MLTPIYKERVELFFHTVQTIGQNPNSHFSLLASTAIFWYLQRAKQVDKAIVVHLFQPNPNACFEPCHQAHTGCLLPRHHVSFPFAHQLIRQPVKIMSHFRSSRVQISSGFLNIFSYIYNQKFFLSLLPMWEFCFSPTHCGICYFGCSETSQPQKLASYFLCDILASMKDENHF